MVTVATDMLTRIPGLDGLRSSEKDSSGSTSVSLMIVTVKGVLLPGDTFVNIIFSTKGTKSTPPM